LYDRGVVARAGAGGFVGRTSELASLHDALAAALAGRGRLVLLVGEPGIGKTRLAEEIAARARDSVVFSREFLGLMTSVHHGPSLRVYFAVFGALMMLTAATLVAARLELGVFNNVVMLGIAVTKATLVVLFFMHVRYGPRLVQTVAVAGFAWLAILVAFVLADYFTRAAVLGGDVV